MRMLNRALLTASMPLFVFALMTAASQADDFQKSDKPGPEAGFDVLLHKPMSGGFLKAADIDRLYLVWEPEVKAQAEKATAEERHRMTFDRYGFIARTSDATGLPLGFTDDGTGNLVTNCFSCHGGKVAGQTVPGLGNCYTDLTTLSTDLRKLKALDSGADPSKISDVKFPLPANFAKGVTNATMFAIVLRSMRDNDLNLTGAAPKPYKLTNNDMDPPPWWHYKKKDWIYCDAFGNKSTRSLMQFTMSPSNTGEMIHSYEPAFEQIREFIMNVQPPKYPFAIDQALAAKGREAFETTCARCHGTYGANGKFPNKVIPIEKIGTDRTRYDALPSVGRDEYNKGWFANYGEHPVLLKTEGYIAQPLDGIWASAPYFHNGSVPTIHDVFNPATRPKIWKRHEDDKNYDEKKIGLKVDVVDAVPAGLSTVQERTYYDTATPSHGNGGHTFPDDDLNPDEKIAVMEYLKTL